MNRSGVLQSILLMALPLAAAQPGFVPLFSGRDLKGFQPTPGSWVAENGVLTLKDRTDHKMRNENYLWTGQVYGDFVLDLEFKVSEGANSGVFIRTANVKEPVQTGIEIQVGASSPDRPLSRSSVGGIYDLVAPKTNAFKPGAWNRYVITCQGARVTVMLNNQVTAEADLDQWKEARKNPDGSPNKFRRPLRDFARSGYIGFQDHGTPVSYRNIRIKAPGAASQPRP